MMRVVRLTRLKLEELAPLRKRAAQEGFRFLDRLAEEYQSGANRFDGPGEALFGVYREAAPRPPIPGEASVYAEAFPQDWGLGGELPILGEAPVVIGKLSQTWELGGTAPDVPGSGETSPGELSEAQRQTPDAQDWAAVGGLNSDPYLNDPQIGRVRRVYVVPEYRRRGVGRLLLNAIIAEARTHYRLLTLRTDTAEGAAFYETLGFQTKPAVEGATHWLDLT